MNKQQYLQKLGITQWQLRTPEATTSEASSTELADHWSTLAATVKACTLCSLCQTRKQTVFGIGNRRAELLLIGEAPGASEDERGEPFVGAAGQLLDKMLAAIELSREQVYIANMVKCRPPNNREPLPNEISQCASYLEQQVALIQPKLILALGRIAAQNLLHTTAPLNRLREQTFAFGAQRIPLIATYHPAYLLRNPADKRNAYHDLLRTRSMLNQIR